MAEMLQPSASRQSMRPLHKLFVAIVWLFPFVLAGLSYLAATYYEPAQVLKTSVLEWPVPEHVYSVLLVQVLIAIIWLVGEFISISSRETVVSALQFAVTVSTVSALIFTGLGGWMLGNGRIEWWLVVPWTASVVDALISGWLSINNAAQKPFLSKKGTS